MEKGTANCSLLIGVTGSGKTTVFIKLIEKTLLAGKTALMLVPEIALTPQTMKIFRGLFGKDIAILHSGLTMSERAEEYRRINAGKVKIVIGTRSAVFAPLENIGIIILDEEGDGSYKSERNPRYHAREIAKQRVKFHNAVLLLASATPSIVSYHNAVTGKYSLFKMNKRYSKSVLPDVYIVDMLIEKNAGNKTNFSQVLINELRENYKRGEQSMLLLNRRGYYTYAKCVNCDTAVTCPNCELPLTYHSVNNRLQCHLCGFSRTMPKVCDNCGSGFVHMSGTGTQRIQDELQSLIPDARILRMDADSIVNKTMYEECFRKFGQGDYDIMVGTQMIAKGLDFENVTLVGVLLIDKSLYIGDYQGYEKTFSLVTQVVGRCGRGAKKGRAYVQTFSPDHYVLELAASQNYAEFYEQEKAVREQFLFPPFCDIFFMGFVSFDSAMAENGARKFVDIFTATAKTAEHLPYRILGPAKKDKGRPNGKYTYQLLIKGKNTKEFRAIIEKAVIACNNKENVQYYRNVNVYVDVNPV
jgi:primosomal protein N' (replication factor Y)